MKNNSLINNYIKNMIKLSKNNMINLYINYNL